MDIKSIVRKSLDRLHLRKPSTRHEIVDSWLANVQVKVPGITTVKPHSVSSMLTGTITGIHTWPTSASTITNNTTVSTINPYVTGAVSQSSVNFFALHNTVGKEIVRLDKHGSVTWADEINVDEAAASFARSLSCGAERSVGITYAVKQRMRDAVFEELIDMAKAKGSLTVDDLTYLHQAAKIMDKLKGIKE